MVRFIRKNVEKVVDLLYDGRNLFSEISQNIECRFLAEFF